MGGRKRVFVLGFLGFVLLVGALAAFLFLPTLIAVGLALLVLVIVLSMLTGPSRRRWDAASKAQAEAAQRGDQAPFLGDRHDHTF